MVLHVSEYNKASVNIARLFGQQQLWCQPQVLAMVLMLGAPHYLQFPLAIDVS